MADDQTPQRLSLSEERLRAALAEMELRLRIYFDDQLKHKADASKLAELSLKVDSLDRGDFTPVHERALTDFIENLLLDKADRGWTMTQRVLGVVGAVIVILSFILSIYVVASSGRPASAPAPIRTEQPA